MLRTFDCSVCSMKICIFFNVLIFSITEVVLLILNNIISFLIGMIEARCDFVACSVYMKISNFFVLQLISLTRSFLSNQYKDSALWTHSRCTWFPLHWENFWTIGVDIPICMRKYLIRITRHSGLILNARLIICNLYCRIVR